MAKTIQWMKIVVQCKGCQKTSNVVLGTKTREEKPIAKCPLCKANTIEILSVTPAQASF
jgi:hypothetical protein